MKLSGKKYFQWLAQIHHNNDIGLIMYLKRGVWPDWAIDAYRNKLTDIQAAEDFKSSTKIMEKRGLL